MIWPIEICRIFFLSWPHRKSNQALQLFISKGSTTHFYFNIHIYLRVPVVVLHSVTRAFRVRLGKSVRKQRPFRWVQGRLSFLKNVKNFQKWTAIYCCDDISLTTNVLEDVHLEDKFVQNKLLTASWRTGFILLTSNTQRQRICPWKLRVFSSMGLHHLELRRSLDKCDSFARHLWGSGLASAVLDAELPHDDWRTGPKVIDSYSDTDVLTSASGAQYLVRFCYWSRKTNCNPFHSICLAKLLEYFHCSFLTLWIKDTHCITLFSFNIISIFPCLSLILFC